MNYLPKKNQPLDKWGLHNPIRDGECIKMSKDFKEATSGDVFKFEKAGDSIEGVYQGYEESRQYPDSYAVRIKQGDEVRVVFVSGIVIDKLTANGVKAGQEINIEFLGKKQNQKKTQEYNDYKVLYK